LILVDTSVWIDHLRDANPPLVSLLLAGDVLSHPFVIGEMALGNLRRRREVLELLAALPTLKPVTDGEVLTFVEAHDLPDTGIGWVDAHLLAAVHATGHSVLTSDKSLRSAAVRLGLAAPVR
jgi:predicted nucleic acid-binding protein